MISRDWKSVPIYSATTACLDYFLSLGVKKSIKIKDRTISFHNENDTRALDLSKVGVVMDCTGHTGDRRFLRQALMPELKCSDFWTFHRRR